MSEEELERIKSAYNSGLKVQIWSCGNWIDFDAREYPFGGFSTKRQYRIVGDKYAEINQLETENNKFLDVINNQDVKIADLEKQIEKMKCCQNCENWTWNMSNKKCQFRCESREACDNWKLKE